MNKTELMKNLAERVLTFRAMNGITQVEFARRANVSESVITHLETRPEKMKLRETTVRKIEYALMGGALKK